MPKPPAFARSAGPTNCLSSRRAGAGRQPGAAFRLGLRGRSRPADASSRDCQPARGDRAGRTLLAAGGALASPAFSPAARPPASWPEQVQSNFHSVLKQKFDGFCGGHIVGFGAAGGSPLGGRRGGQLRMAPRAAHGGRAAAAGEHGAYLKEGIGPHSAAALAAGASRPPGFEPLGADGWPYGRPPLPFKPKPLVGPATGAKSGWLRAAAAARRFGLAREHEAYRCGLWPLAGCGGLPGRCRRLL